MNNFIPSDLEALNRIQEGIDYAPDTTYADLAAFRRDQADSRYQKSEHFQKLVMDKLKRSDIIPKKGVPKDNVAQRGDEGMHTITELVAEGWTPEDVKSEYRKANQPAPAGESIRELAARGITAKIYSDHLKTINGGIAPLTLPKK